MCKVLLVGVLSIGFGSCVSFAQSSGTADVSAARATAGAITIDQAVEEAIRNNPALLAERFGIPVAETAVITAGLRPNPVVSVSSDHLDWLGTHYSEANGAGPVETALRVDLPIERAHKREFRLDTAGFGKKIAEVQLSDSLRKLRLDVTLACIDVIEARTRLALAQDNLKSLEGIVQLNQSRLGGGAIAPVELTRSRVAMLQFRTSVKSAALALSTARARLQALLGRPAAAPLVDVAGELATSVPAKSLDFQEMLQKAYIARPDLQAIQLQQARSTSELRLQAAQGKIDYSVGMEYRRQQGVNGTGNSLGLFVSAPIPVYSRNQGEIARVVAEEVQLRKSFEALQAQIAGEISAAHKEFDTARELVTDIERDLIKPSEEARDTTRYVYQAGATSLMEVLDAQRAFNETMSTYYGAQADFRRASVRLTAVVGGEVIQ